MLRRLRAGLNALNQDLERNSGNRRLDDGSREQALADPFFASARAAIDAGKKRKAIIARVSCFLEGPASADCHGVILGCHESGWRCSRNAEPEPGARGLVPTGFRPIATKHSQRDIG